jgi:glycine betaine/proline transport system substrate-binding protein
MNRQLVWIEANQADGDTAATHFLKNFEAVWSAWLSADIAAKVKNAVAGL